MIDRFARSPIGLCLVLSLLVHLRQVAFLAVIHNRYMLHWRRLDAFALLAALLGTAAVIYALHALLGRVGGGRLARLRSPFLLTVGLSGAVSFASFFDFASDRSLTFAWWIGLLLIVIPSAFAAERLHPVLLRVGSVFSIVVLATFVQVLTWSPWSGPPDPLVPARDSREAAIPVYVFLFDEWSYEQSFDGLYFRDELPNLRDLQAGSLTFLHAYAPAPDTEISLPRLLFSRDGGWSLEKEAGRTYWVRDRDRVPTAGSPQLFDPFQTAGYQTAMLGYYLPYRRLLGERVDVVRSVPHVPWGRGFAGSFSERMLNSLRLLMRPGSLPSFVPSKKVAYSEHWRDINRDIHRDVMEVLGDWPDNTFLFAHWPVPHAPFVFEADGSYRGPFEDSRVFGTDEDYLRSLRNLDRIVGETVQKLQRNGRFERSLLILTSDHGWKKRDEVPIRVPLVIKWPHQSEGILVEGAFPTLALPGLLEGFAFGRRELAEALQYIAEHRVSGPGS